VSSKHDPILLLEPSNLLEPLSLEDRGLDPFNREARFGRDGTLPSGTARTRSRPISVARGRRWPLKSALIVAGGLACFGAGTAMPGLSMFGDIQRSQPVAGATRPAPADAPVKPEAAKPAEAKLTESTPPRPSQAAPLDANANANGANANGVGNAAPSAAQAPDQPAVDRSAPAATDAIGGGPTPATNAPPADPRRAAPRADGRQQDTESAQPSPRNRRAAQRDTADQSLAPDESIPSASPGDVRPNRDANRASSRRRDRSASDNFRAANDWDLWRDQDADRPSSRRRDRFDEDARDDDRRAGRRSSRYGGRSLFPFFGEW
jgi:hypothetical protein